MFWNSTLTEYTLAIDGFSEANGGGKKEDGPSDREMAALLERYG